MKLHMIILVGVAALGLVHGCTHTSSPWQRASTSSHELKVALAERDLPEAVPVQPIKWRREVSPMDKSIFRDDVIFVSALGDGFALVAASRQVNGRSSGPWRVLTVPEGEHEEDNAVICGVEEWPNYGHAVNYFADFPTTFNVECFEEHLYHFSWGDPKAPFYGQAKIRWQGKQELRKPTTPCSLRR